MRILFCFIISIVFHLSFIAQTLNLPARSAASLNGTQFVALVTNYSLTLREDEIYNQITSGNVPAFQRNLIPVTTSALISSVTYNVTYYVVPDYLAIGCDTNYFLCPMTPLLAQRLADYMNCILPTRKMVNQIWTAASCKLAPSTIPPSAQMTTIPVMSQHNTTVWGQRSAVISTYPLGTLTGGDKKDVVISNIIYGNPSPGRVVIYGWHQLNGSAIQPLYNGHEESYADYSHGIRMVQKAITINGSSSTVNNVLTSSTLNSLLSDEGVISVPRYPAALTQIATPTSFAVLRESSTSIRLNILNNPSAIKYKIQLSADGINFTTTLFLNPSNTVVTGLIPDSLYFVRIAAISSSDTSVYSEILAATTSICPDKVIIVNGFDRASTGNTFDFIRQHGKAFWRNGYGFSSATNEAISSGQINLSSYKITDYILGNESTANETFGLAEQTLVKSYLNSGGCLFISGAEIAWDLDHSGTTVDKDFYNQYLKSSYVNDAPNGQTGVYYQCQGTIGNIFESIPSLTFDNGTHGTFNVSYPDVIAGVNGGVNCLQYSGLTNNFAGVLYSGMFPSGTVAGKLINLGFPFETIYPESSRILFMGKILDFFNISNRTANPTVTSPVIYNQNETATALSAIGQNLLWYADSVGGVGQTIAPVPITTVPETYFYYVSQTINQCESNRSKIKIIVNSGVGYSVSGVINYLNTALTPISNATVNLMNGSGLVATVISDVNGHYSFSNIANGTYTIFVSYSNSWGGVTATDALKMKRHIAGLELFTEPIKLTAADPNNTTSINSTDVLLVQRRLAGLDLSFTRPDWLFEIQTTGGNSITVNGTNTAKNLYGLCTGDVNGSYVPAK